MRDLNVGLLRGRRGPGGVRREGRGLGTVGFGLRGRRGRCEGSRQLLIKGQHGGGLYDLGAIRQSTLGASSWLLGNRDGTQRRQHSWKVPARQHASEEGDRENRQEAQADQRRADTARAARWAPPQETRVARSRHRRGVVTTSSSQSRFAPRLSASASSDKNRRAGAAMPHHTDDVTACEENAVTSSSRVSPPGTPSRPRAPSGADSTTVSTMSPLARVVPCRQSRRGDSSSRASVAPPGSYRDNSQPMTSKHLTIQGNTETIRASDPPPSAAATSMTRTLRLTSVAVGARPSPRR